jgi:hypothetical protein
VVRVGSVRPRDMSQILGRVEQKSEEKNEERSPRKNARVDAFRSVERVLRRNLLERIFWRLTDTYDFEQFFRGNNVDMPNTQR